MWLSLILCLWLGSAQLPLPSLLIFHLKTTCPPWICQSLPPEPGFPPPRLGWQGHPGHSPMSPPRLWQLSSYSPLMLLFFLCKSQPNGAFPAAFTCVPLCSPSCWLSSVGFSEHAAAEYPSDLSDPAAFPAGSLQTKPDSLSSPSAACDAESCV